MVPFKLPKQNNQAKCYCRHAKNPQLSGFLHINNFNYSGYYLHRYRKVAKLNQDNTITFTADGPLAPFSIENETSWPSSNVLKLLL